jgi:hypothetical protein
MSYVFVAIEIDPLLAGLSDGTDRDGHRQV